MRVGDLHNYLTSELDVRSNRGSSKCEVKGVIYTSHVIYTTTTGHDRGRHNTILLDVSITLGIGLWLNA